MVEEVIRWRRGERLEVRPEEQSEDTNVGQKIDSAGVAEVIARHGETGSLSTSDRTEWVAFLGFDPGFPARIGDNWTGDLFDADITSEWTRASCTYFDGQQDEQIVSLRMYAFTDMTESQLVLEQASKGEWLDCGGLPVYHYTNSGRASYLWTQDKCVYRLTVNITGQETENVFREVMAWWRGVRPEEQHEEQPENIGADQ